MPLCCVLLAVAEGGLGKGLERMSRVHHRGVERLGDDYREHGENNRWGCWGDWGRSSICGVFCFFILSRAVNSRGLAAFRDGFRKGLGLNFFLQLRSIGRKRGKGFGEWRAWFLILKLYGFNFSEWYKGRERNCKIYISIFSYFWECNFF